MSIIYLIINYLQYYGSIGVNDAKVDVNISNPHLEYTNRQPTIELTCRSAINQTSADEKDWRA